MPYLSHFPSAGNVLDAGPRAPLSAGGSRLAARISSMVKWIGGTIDKMADFYAAATLYDELSRLSDAELQRRGLSRAALAADIRSTRDRVRD